MPHPMTNRERVLATYRGEPLDRIVWQPRLYYWHYARRRPNRPPLGFGREMIEEYYRAIPPWDAPEPLPPEWDTETMLELHRRLGVSPRYAAEVLGVSPFRVEFDPAVKVRERVDGARLEREIETPFGALREVVEHAAHLKFPVKGPADFDAARWLLEHSRFEFDPAAWHAADEAFGDMGVPQVFFPRAPLQRLFVEMMGIEAAVWALFEHPEETGTLMCAIAEWDDAMYATLAASPAEIMCFGENLDARFDSPALLEEHLCPYYERRVAQLHQAGKFCSVHADGAVRPILRLLVECGFDAIEAPTPKPQGDVTLEEIKTALGDHVILQDGIPALLFCPEFSEDELLACAEKILRMFAPRLILGASDEVPPDADLGRVRMVGELVKKFKPPQSAHHAGNGEIL